MVGDGVGLGGLLLGSQLHELVHGVLLEEVTVHGESVGNGGGGDLGQTAGFSGKVTTDVLLQESDDLDGIGVILE